MTQEQAAGRAALMSRANPYARWFVLLGLVTAAVMEVLDTSIVNVAIPQISGNLGATLDEVGWVATGYILSNVIVLPMTSWLASLFGRKRYLSGSILLFIGASVMCGLSSTLPQLVFWRIVQGAGGAALLSTAQATLFETFPPQQQGLVQALFGLGIVMAPTLGPTVGGIITDNYNWQWIFYINVPIGLLSYFLVVTFIEDSKYAKRQAGFDLPGILLMAVGLGCLQAVLERGERDDWFDASWVCWSTFIAVTTLTAFIIWELHPRNKTPVVDFHVLRTRSYAAGLPLAFALGMGLYGGVFVFPVFAQSLLHFTAQQTGLALLPGGLATAVSMIICGRIVSKVDPRPLVFVGGALFILSMGQLANMTLQSGQSDTYWALIIRGLGLGFLFIPLSISSVQTLPKQDIAQGTALFNLMRQLGGSFGIAALNTLITHQINAHRSDLVSYTDAANPVYNDRLNALTQTFAHLGYGLSTATRMATAAIDNTIQTQAMNLAFNDAFRLLAFVFLAFGPLLLLLRRPKFSLRSAGPGH